MEQQAPDIHGRRVVLEKMLPQWGPTWLRGMTAFAVGCALMQTGYAVLGVQLEWFAGIATFSGGWVLALTILPIGTGVLIGMIYGFGGKYLAHFPPATVLIISYYQSMHVPAPEGVYLLPMGMMTVYIILQMEFCAVGGFIGEILIRKRFGWGPKYGNFADGERLPDDSDS